MSVEAPLVDDDERTLALLENVAIPESLREAWARVEASKHRPRMKSALARVASGESYRQAADAEGYGDHGKLYRLAKRYGLLGAKKEQILAGSKRVALLANQELERRLTERPDEISDRDVTVMGGVAVDKVSAAEGWSKQNTEHESYGSALESLVRRLTESGATFELKVTHPDPADRAIDVTPESSQG